MCKGEDGQPVPLFNSGVRFADGSLSADVPMKSLARQFGVSHFLVSQVGRVGAAKGFHFSLQRVIIFLAVIRGVVEDPGPPV